jgi:hypothetical protein
MTTPSQRSTQLKSSFPRELTGLRTLQSGQEEDFTKTTNYLHSTSSLSSTLINSNQKLSTCSTVSTPALSSESKDLYYNRFLKQTVVSPPIKLSSFSPTKLKTNQIQGLNTPGTSTTSSASLQSNSFQTPNWSQNVYLSQNNHTIDSESNKSCELNHKNHQLIHQPTNIISKFGQISITQNTPPQSPAFIKPDLNDMKHKNKEKILDESNHDFQSINEVVPILNSERLKPTRHETKNCLVCRTFFFFSKP